MKSAALNLLLFFCFCYPFHVECSSDDDTTPPSDSMEDTCEDDNLLPNTAIAVHISKASDGNWTTDFYASNILSNHSRSLKMSLKKKVIGCGEKKYLSVSGYLKDADVHNSPDVSSEEAASNVRGQEERDARMEKIESRLDSIENTLQSFNETMMNVLKNMPGNGYYMHFDDLVKGKKIMLHNNRRTAIRERPHENNGNFGGVLSNIHLRDDVAFEVRIDETIDKWRDLGIALGVIVKKDEAVKDKVYICHNVQGTYGIDSWPTSDKGKSQIYKDGRRISSNGYNLDTRDIPVGTTLGVVRRSNNALHFLLNGIDQGAAFYNIPDHVYAFVDVAKYVSKITINS